MAIIFNLVDIYYLKRMALLTNFELLSFSVNCLPRCQESKYIGLPPLYGLQLLLHSAELKSIYLTFFNVCKNVSNLKFIVSISGL